MTNTGPRSPIYVTRPNREGNGTSRRWTRVIAGRKYGFTAVVMPSGELRYSVSRFDAEPGTPNFGCYWTPVHEIVVKPQPLAWRRVAAGHYTAPPADENGFTIRRDPHAGLDNRWSLRHGGKTVSAHRLLKSAQSRASKMHAEATAADIIARISATDTDPTLADRPELLADVVATGDRLHVEITPSGARKIADHLATRATIEAAHAAAEIEQQARNIEGWETLAAEHNATREAADAAHADPADAARAARFARQLADHRAGRPREIYPVGTRVRISSTSRGGVPLNLQAGTVTDVHNGTMAVKIDDAGAVLIMSGTYIERETDDGPACTYGAAGLTMSLRRPDGHAGDVRSYVFPANGEIALLCEGHADTYGQLAVLVREPMRQQPEQQAAQRDELAPVHAVHYVRGTGEPAACEVVNPTNTSSEEGTVTCGPCLTRLAAARATRNGPSDEATLAGKTADLVDLLVEGYAVELVGVPRRWSAGHMATGALTDVDAETVEYAVATGAVRRHYAPSYFRSAYLSLPDMRDGDVVTVTPMRDGRQFDVLRTEGEVTDGMVRVAPRNPRDVDDAPKWLARTYLRHVRAADVEPIDDDADDDETECEGHESLDGAHMGEEVYCDGSCRRHERRRPAAAEAQPSTAERAAEGVHPIVVRHAAETGQSIDAAEADLRDRAEQGDPELAGPESITVERRNGGTLTFYRGHLVTVPSDRELWRVTRFTSRGGVPAPVPYALLTSQRDPDLKRGAFVSDLTPATPEQIKGRLGEYAGCGALVVNTEFAGRLHVDPYPSIGIATHAEVECGKRGDDGPEAPPVPVPTGPAVTVADVAERLRFYAGPAGASRDVLVRRAELAAWADILPTPTVADWLMPSMPGEYRSVLTHLLDGYGFAEPAGIDAKVPDDTNPDAFLLHDPTGLAVGVYDRYVRLSYPAEHAGEGDGDLGTAVVDLEYGTSFETVVDVAAGLTRRLQQSASKRRVYAALAEHEGGPVRVDRPEIEPHEPVGEQGPCLRCGRDRDADVHLEPFTPEARALLAAGGFTEPDVAVGPIVRHLNRSTEQAVAETRLPDPAGVPNYGAPLDERGVADAAVIAASRPADELLDAGGYLDCGCHGSDREHSCGASVPDTFDPASEV